MSWSSTIDHAVDVVGQIDTDTTHLTNIGWRIDVVSFSLETRHGVWTAQTPIKPKGISKKKRTIGAPEFKLFTAVQGRFTDLLPTRDSQDGAQGQLH